jgi:non-homologous end joining protein Ku
MVRQKRRMAIAKEPAKINVVNLMDALRQCLQVDHQVGQEVNQRAERDVVANIGEEGGCGGG